MEWQNNFNKAIDYIEENLTGEIDLNQLGIIAGCSGFHFKKIFLFLGGIPLNEYIRRRKMTKAAFDLHEGQKVLDVALKYGYDSPTAFNRAFKSIHGFPPSLASEEARTIKSFPPMSFKFTLKGDLEINYRIEKMDPFSVIGFKENFPVSPEENFLAIPDFWKNTAMKIPEILPLMNQMPLGVLGLSTYGIDDRFDYYIGVSSNLEPTVSTSLYEVSANTWAIFQSIGPIPMAIQNLQRRIVTEWFPSSGYEYANAPDIEVYFEGDQSANDYICEVWVPIVKKGGQA